MSFQDFSFPLCLPSSIWSTGQLICYRYSFVASCNPISSTNWLHFRLITSTKQRWKVSIRRIHDLMLKRRPPLWWNFVGFNAVYYFLPKMYHQLSLAHNWLMRVIYVKIQLVLCIIVLILIGSIWKGDDNTLWITSKQKERWGALKSETNVSLLQRRRKKVVNSFIEKHMMIIIIVIPNKLPKRGGGTCCLVHAPFRYTLHTCYYILIQLQYR